jgi:hypothetical protein
LPNAIQLKGNIMPLPGSIIQNPTFNPALAVITGINRANGATVQTQAPHTFVVGQSVHIIVPPGYGMPEINGMLANIVAINSLLPLLFLTDIDSTFFQVFEVPANPTQFAQAVPVGENTLQLNGAFMNVLPPV